MTRKCKGFCYDTYEMLSYVEEKYVKKVSQIVLICGIVFSLSACTETENSNESKQENVQEKIYKIGETVDVDGLQVTLDSVQLGYPDYTIDKKKDDILGIVFTVKNNSKRNTFCILRI